LPALMVTDTAFFRNPNYHLPSDTIDTLDFTFMAELVKSLELALLELPPAPTRGDGLPQAVGQAAPPRPQPARRRGV
jgi:hypothetical protein